MEMDEIIGLEEESPKTEHTVYELFKWSLILKGAISVAEVIAGMLLLIIPSELIVEAVHTGSSLLLGNANNPIAVHVLEELTRFGEGAALFVALYLLSRGLIKCFLIWGLLRNLMWAYPASLTVLGLFLVYQAYQVFVAHSYFVIAITAFDVVVMYFIWREWRIVRRHANDSKTV